PKDGCHRHLTETLLAQIAAVAILSRPEGRLPPHVLPFSVGADAGCDPQPPRRTAATPPVTVAAVGVGPLRSSAGAKDGCHRTAERNRPGGEEVRSSAAPKDGCHLVSTAWGDRGSALRSSAAPKDGCHPSHSAAVRGPRSLRSSAAPKDGCHLPVGRRWGGASRLRSSDAPKDGCHHPCGHLQVAG